MSPSAARVDSIVVLTHMEAALPQTHFHRPQMLQGQKGFGKTTFTGMDKMTGL